jgi:hypothetical protein
MKNLIIIFVIAPLLAMSPTENASLEQITQAISSGNASALGAYFDSNVEIAVLDEEDVYSKNQAVKVVQNFFNKNKPTSFSQVHQGTSKGNDSKYCIGNMSTEGGTFRVYVYMKTNGGNYLIQELRFDKE